MCGSEHRGAGWNPRSRFPANGFGGSPLVMVTAVSLAARLSVVALWPDSENDAYGHLNVARALLAQPLNPGIHWVWLPAWHYVVAGGLELGMGHAGVRVANAFLTCLGPWLLLHVLRGLGPTFHSPRSENPPKDWSEWAAVALALAPLPNRLGTTALVETVFSLLLLLGVWGLVHRRFGVLSAALGVACLSRYEAWGAVVALGGAWLFDRRGRVPFHVLLGPVGAILSLVVVRRWCDGTWFRFARDTHSFGLGVNGTLPLWMLVMAVPCIALVALGPALCWLPKGLSGPPELWIIPAGVLSFLGVAYLASSIPPVDRYLTALTPFACAAVARGLSLARRTNARRNALLLASLALLSVGHMGYAAVRGSEIARYDPVAPASALSGCPHPYAPLP